MKLPARITFFLGAILLVWPALAPAQDLEQSRALLRLIGICRPPLT